MIGEPNQPMHSLLNRADAARIAILALLRPSHWSLL